MQRAAGTLSGREYERRLQELEEEAGPPAARAADGAKECSPHPQRLLCYTCPGHSGAGHFLHLWPRVATPHPPSLAARCERSLTAATAVAGAPQAGAVVGADPCVPAAAQGLLPGPRGALCCPVRLWGRCRPAASAGARASRISRGRIARSPGDAGPLLRAGVAPDTPPCRVTVPRGRAGFGGGDHADGKGPRALGRRARAHAGHPQGLAAREGQVSARTRGKRRASGGGGRARAPIRKTMQRGSRRVLSNARAASLARGALQLSVHPCPVGNMLP